MVNLRNYRILLRKNSNKGILSLRVGFATFLGAKVVSRSIRVPKVLDTLFPLLHCGTKHSN